ncbi:hypothetical protein ACFWGD_04165 [Corynebacterium sp. NPDC060344]|uniref:hypothetical protein n=1 Tax=Corynebacterium sp. NPDC060344 TaxID=3347101 RepID=UPI0036640DA1
MKNSIISFVSPARRELIIGMTVIAVFLAAGRFIMLDGTVWNIMALIAVVGLAAAVGRKIDGVRALDIPVRTWFPGAMAVLATGAAALSGIATLSMWVSYARNPWYSHFDLFVVTNGGGAPFLDTNGEPYLVEGAGTDPSTWALTYLVLLALFLAAGVAGTTFGVAVAAWSPVAAIAVPLAGLAIVYVSGLAANAAGMRFEEPALSAIVWAIPITIAAVGFTWFASNRVEP